MAIPVIKFRNVQNSGDWERGGTYTFEFFIWKNLPDDGVGYEDGEEIESVALMTNAGLYDDGSQDLVGDYPFFSTGLFITDLYDDDDEFDWLGDAFTGIVVTAVEEIEATDNDQGHWYRATVLVEEDAEIGNYKIMMLHRNGTVDTTPFEIIGGHLHGAGPEKWIYISGNYVDTFTYVTYDIINSTYNDGSYETGGAGSSVVYNADENRTEIYAGDLPEETYDGYIVITGEVEVPG